MPYLPSPKVTRKELEYSLSKHFGFGKLVSYKKLKKGFANSLYHIKTSRGDFVFKVSVRHNKGDKIKYEIKLLNSIHNLPVPRPVKTKRGEYLFDFKGHKTFIYPFLPGREKNKFTKKMLFEIGEFLGKLHLQTEGFKSSVKRIEYYAISPVKLKNAITRSRHVKNLKIKQALVYLKLNALKYHLPNGLPTGAMHIDVKPENVLFKGGRLSGVIDFDNSYIGPLIFDLADTLMWFASENGKFNVIAAKSVYGGYKSARKLNKEEHLGLFNALHNVFLSISLCGIDLLIQKKLPESLIVWVIDNLLEAEKNLDLTKSEFEKIFN